MKKGGGFVGNLAGEYETVERPTMDTLAGFGWQTANLLNEQPGPDNPTGRLSLREVLLPARLRAALARLNPRLPPAALADAEAELARDRGSMGRIEANQEVHRLLRHGVPVSLSNPDGSKEPVLVRVIDWGQPGNNDFLLASQPWVHSPLYKRRPDLIGFVNGVPLLLIECKNPTLPLADAFEANLRDYRDAIPHLFPFNGFVVLTNGVEARMGAAEAPYDRFMPWPRATEDAPDDPTPATLLQQACSPAALLDLVDNFILFELERTSAGTRLVKKVARYHQVLGVNRAVAAVGRVAGNGANDGRLGVVWHTQGSGKSLSMVMFSEKVLRTLGNNWTFVIITDRTELDDQIAGTYAATGALTKRIEDAQAQSRTDLRRLLAGQERYVFTLIHKFGLERGEVMEALSQRRDVIVLTDEAHRSQYDQLALNMRRALPHAAFLAFTGTPLIAGGSARTREVFGDYVSIYDFAQSIADGATVPLFYDERKPELHLAADLRDQWAELVEEQGLDDDAEAMLRRKYAVQYALLTNPERQDKVAADLVRHFAHRGYRGKAMFVAIDKAAAVAMFDRVRAHWAALIDEEERAMAAVPAQARDSIAEQLEWMRGLDMAVVVSQAQNEVDDLKRRGLDIAPHRGRMQLEKLDDKFKDPNDPLALVFVCAMWITGFDVPTCSTMYLDKPLRNHTLMQAIARANRRAAGKDAGLIVDYAGVFASLQRALAVYASPRAGEGGGTGPIQAKGALADAVEAALAPAEAACRDAKADVSAFFAAPKPERPALIRDAGEALIAPDERRRTFLRLVDGVVRAYKALLPDEAAAGFLPRVGVLVVVAEYIRNKTKPGGARTLAEQFELLLRGAITADDVAAPLRRDTADGLLDLSGLDFEKLAELFAGKTRTAAEAVREAAEAQVATMAAENPTRAGLVEKLEELVNAYNAATLDAAAFLEKLKEFCAGLDEEKTRAAREGLAEAELAIFDLLTRPEPKLTAAQTVTVKAAARALLAKLKELVAVPSWAVRQQPRAQVFSTIRVELDALPEDAYPEALWKAKVGDVFQFVTRRYGAEGVGAPPH